MAERKLRASLVKTSSLRGKKVFKQVPDERRATLKTRADYEAHLQEKKTPEKTPDEHCVATLEERADYEARLARLEVEFNEIADRYDRLRKALERGDAFKNEVGDEQYALMVKQAGAMQSYRDTLAIRIALFRRGGKNG